MKPVAGIEISFKEKDIKYLEFLFVYYMDDPIRKDHDWELFDRLSPRKRQKHNQLEFGTAIRNLSERLDLLSHVCFS